MTSLTTYHVLTLQNGNMTRHKGGVVSTVQCIYQDSNTLATLYSVVRNIRRAGTNIGPGKFGNWNKSRALNICSQGIENLQKRIKVKHGSI